MTKNPRKRSRRTEYQGRNELEPQEWLYARAQERQQQQQAFDNFARRQIQEMAAEQQAYTARMTHVQVQQQQQFSNLLARQSKEDREEIERIMRARPQRGRQEESEAEENP